MKTLDKNSKVLVIVESPHKTNGVTAIFKSLGFKNVRVVATGDQAEAAINDIASILEK